MKESVKSIGANLAGGPAGGVAVELASKVLNNRSMIFFKYKIIYRKLLFKKNS